VGGARKHLRPMGKKKGKPATFRPEPDEEAEGEDVATADATTAPTPPPPPPPPTADDAGAASDKPTVDAATSAMAPDAAAGTSAEDGEAPAIRAGMVVTGTLETRHVPSVPYCEVCSMPFEFCEWNPLFKKCKENFAENGKKHFPHADGDEELAALMARLGFEGGDAASKKAQSSKKPAAEDGSAPQQNKKKEKTPPEILIELNNRNKKKHITIVKGLDHFGVDTAAAAKTFGKKFACGSALKKAQDGQPESIEIQGNYRDELAAVMVDKLKLKLEDIAVLVDGKKVKATDMPGS